MIRAMSLLLTGVRVLVADGPDAALTADRLTERGALPVTAGDLLPDAPVGLVHIAATTPPDAATAALSYGADHGVPVDDRRPHDRTAHDRTAHDRTAHDRTPHDRTAHDRTPHGRTGIGEVVLVGGGPGDPDLITVAGAREIAAADVILADHLGPVELAERAAEGGVEFIDVSKIPYARQVTQDRINELLIDRARSGRRVVRLKGGDPFIFGRGFEEIEACAAAGVPVRVVPGVTSATSAPAVAGFSVTHRGLNHDLTLISGHVPPESPKSLVDWDATARMTGTLVLIMAVRNAGAIAARLIAGGKPAATPVAVVESASTPQERVTTTTLAELGETVAREGLGSPAIIVVGEAAGRRAVLG
jgi:uroporphyrin-III C-methyltransferase